MAHKNRHQACKEIEVLVTQGEEFEWVTDSESCDIQILQDHPLDQDHYTVVKGTPTPAKVIGAKGSYNFKCQCKDDARHPTINPHIKIS
jgi:hypothetical protein